eukprot:m.735654 g.735654  ORF g.735654 m.735654 type:complete len:841 (-) comp23092_c0_seq1:2984-5506(-)
MAAKVVMQVDRANIMTDSKDSELLETRELLAAEQSLRRVLEDKIHSLSVKLSELSAENRRLVSSRQESTDNGDILTKQLEQSRIVQFQLEKDLSAARQDYQTAEGHLKDVMAQSAHQETKFLHEIARLTAQLDASKKANVKDDKLQADLESMMLDTKGEARKLQVRLDESRQECLNLTEAVTALEGINGESSAKIAQLQETVQMYEGQFPEALAESASKKATAKGKSKKVNKYDNVSSRYRTSGIKSCSKNNTNGTNDTVDGDVQAEIDESVKTSAWSLQKQLIADKNLLKKEVDELAAQVQKLKLTEGELSYENANLTAMVNLLQSRLHFLKEKYAITEEDSVIVPPQQHALGADGQGNGKAIEKSSSISRLRKDMYGTLSAANDIVTFLMNMLTLRKKKKVIQVKYQPNPNEDANEEPLGAPEGDVSLEEIQVIKSGLSAFLGPLQKTFGAGGKKAREFEAALALAGAQKEARESPSASPMRPIKEHATPPTETAAQPVWELPPPLVDLLPTPQSSDDGLEDTRSGDEGATRATTVVAATRLEPAGEITDLTTTTFTPESKSSKDRMAATEDADVGGAAGSRVAPPAVAHISFLGTAGDLDTTLDTPSTVPVTMPAVAVADEQPRRKLEFQTAAGQTTEPTAVRPLRSVRGTTTTTIVAQNVAGGIHAAAVPSKGKMSPVAGAGRKAAASTPPTAASKARGASTPTGSTDNAGDAMPPAGKTGKRKKVVPAWKQVVLDDRAKAQAKRVANREKWANRSKVVANSGLSRGKPSTSSATRRGEAVGKGSELLKVRDATNDTAYTLHNTSGGIEANDVTQLVMKTMSSSRGGMRTSRKTIV